MTILDQTETSLHAFRPKNPREFVALQLARRFDDVSRLPRYLIAAREHSKQALLDAAKVATLRHELNRTPLRELFFEVLAERKGVNPHA